MTAVSANEEGSRNWRAFPPVEQRCRIMEIRGFESSGSDESRIELLNSADGSRDQQISVFGNF